MAKKLVIFMASVGVAAAVVSAVASRKRRGTDGTPLLEAGVNGARKLARDWRAEDDALNTELKSVVADEIGANR